MKKKNVLLNTFVSVGISCAIHSTLADEFVQPKNTASESTSEQWVVPKNQNREVSSPEAADADEPKSNSETQLAPKAEKAPAAVPATGAETPGPVVRLKPKALNSENKKPEDITLAKIQAPLVHQQSNSPEVLSVNPRKKFVIVHFKDGKIPPAGSRFGVYRSDTFVGSISLTNPITPPYASADIVTGNIQSGDYVR